MERQKNNDNKKELNRVDFISLKRKGLTKEKISKLLGVSVKETERLLALQSDVQFISGVF